MTKRFIGILALILLALSAQWWTVDAAPVGQQASCLFFTETGGGEGGFSVCNDSQANFRSAFEQWGLLKIGYPISQRYVRDGFVTQAFQKAIMQWRPESSSVSLVNVFDDLHNAGFDSELLRTRQTPTQLPDGWDGNLPFEQVVSNRQALLNERPALRQAYFASNDPLTFYGLPTSEIVDFGNHFAVRLQRAVLQEWKEQVPWAQAGEVTIANGGDIAKELGALPAEALRPESEPSNPGASPTATPRPSGFNPDNITLGLEPVVSGLQSPVAVVSAGDGSGRLFVVEKGGKIRVFENGELLLGSFLDISNQVSDASEQGLLGMAFEPNRPDRFYINYTNHDGDTIIARYRVQTNNRNQADPSSAETLMTIQQPADNHNGGHLLFGPDGYLWIGMGDGGGAGDTYQHAQTPRTPLGAMLRLDISGESGYTVPPDNPYRTILAAAPEVWAYGLRNPWRYSFDRLTGELWIADVGQGQWEEVNRVSATEPALNYGWPIMEGNHCYRSTNCSQTGLVRPITEYDHSDGCSITGGYVYRGQAYPQLVGGYLFSDFCSGNFWVIDASSRSFTQPTMILQSGRQISSFGEDETGELYVTSYNGTLYRVVAN